MSARFLLRLMASNGKFFSGSIVWLGVLYALLEPVLSLRASSPADAPGLSSRRRHEKSKIITKLCSLDTSLKCVLECQHVKGPHLSHDLRGLGRRRAQDDERLAEVVFLKAQALDRSLASQPLKRLHAEQHWEEKQKVRGLSRASSACPSESTPTPRPFDRNMASVLSHIAFPTSLSPPCCCGFSKTRGTLASLRQNFMALEPGLDGQYRE